MSDSNKSVAVPAFFPLLALLFIGLKLTGYIDWSWWLVLLPLYGPALFMVVVAVVAFVVAMMIHARY